MLHKIAYFLAALLLVALVNANGNPGFKHVVTLEKEIVVPQMPTNPYYAVSYGCVVWNAAVFKQFSNAYITRIKDLNNESIAHHGWMTTFPAHSYFFLPGQVLENPEDGKFYPDCLGVGSGFQTIFPQQAKLSDLNTFATDSDASAANGYRLGFDVHSNPYDEWIIAQVHLHGSHASHMKRSMTMEEETTVIKYEVHLTSVTPERRAGWISQGLTPYRPLKVNSDGEHLISVITPPSTTNINLVQNPQDFQQCVQYCPTQNPVHYENYLEGRFEQSGVTTGLIEGGYVHAHAKQYKLSVEVIRADGTPELIYSCDDCGAMGQNPDSWKWFDTPVPFSIGDGLRTNCTYKHRDNSTDDIEFGFASDDEMCIPFFIMSYVEKATVEPLWVPLGGFCDSLHNPGYPNQELALASAYQGVCSLPTCAADCVCNPGYCGFF